MFKWHQKGVKDLKTFGQDQTCGIAGLCCLGGCCKNPTGYCCEGIK
ncbi:MAG: hypothetical protein RBS43_08820 [Candidatus Cloacimonas sp.]|nr:hypothetical protein [Candidatus Cloacimonas sp.]